MLSTMEKIKLSGERVKLIAQLKQNELKGMAKIKASKRIVAIVALLGGEQNKYLNLEPVNADDVQPLNMADVTNMKEAKQAINTYLKQFQGKTIQTVDNKTVRFSGQSARHFNHDIFKERSVIAEAVSHFMDVLQTGEFVGRQLADKERGDFVAFHVYRKWVEVADAKVHMQVKVAELLDGSLATDGLDLLVYTLKDYELDKEKEDNRKLSSDGEIAYDRVRTYEDDGFANAPIRTPLSLANNHNTLFDEMQEKNTGVQGVPMVIEILEIVANDEATTPSKTPTTKDTTSQAKSPIYSRSNSVPSHVSSRQTANNKAIDLLADIESRGLNRDDLSDEELATLANYTGNGGGVVAKNGRKGSAYEYYTPKAVAAGMWDLAKELGFHGGKVLDPSAGTGVFASAMPKNAMITNIELDSVSGGISKVLNDGDNSKTHTMPFEQAVSMIEDDSMDMIITNTPFGDNSARGKYKMMDSAYQDERLENYFILRSLEKLRHGGLAIFITPTSVVSRIEKPYERLRTRASLKAEFLGAYRLPNSVFEQTGADVITDVIAFRKYDRDTTDKINELYQSGKIDVLKNANVLYDDFISGKYFRVHRKFILGESQVVEDKRFGGMKERVVTNKRTPEIQHQAK